MNSTGNLHCSVRSKRDNSVVNNSIKTQPMQPSGRPSPAKNPPLRCGHSSKFFCHLFTIITIFVAQNAPQSILTARGFTQDPLSEHTTLSTLLARDEYSSVQTLAQRGRTNFGAPHILKSNLTVIILQNSTAQQQAAKESN